MRAQEDEKDYDRKKDAMAGNGKWTDEEIRDLGATTDLQALADIFGCSLWMSRKMARTGEWERQGIKIFRIGAFYRVGVPSILDVLGFSSPTPAPRKPYRKTSWPRQTVTSRTGGTEVPGLVTAGCQ